MTHSAPGKPPPLRLDESNCRAELNGGTISLSPTETRLLSCLLEHAGQCVPLETLAQALGAEPATVQVHIHNLRRKLEDDPSQPALIQSVKGQGYMIPEQD